MGQKRRKSFPAGPAKSRLKDLASSATMRHGNVGEEEDVWGRECDDATQKKPALLQERKREKRGILIAAFTKKKTTTRTNLDVIGIHCSKSNRAGDGWKELDVGRSGYEACERRFVGCEKRRKSDRKRKKQTKEDKQRGNRIRIDT